jgi:hypothetical protein
MVNPGDNEEPRFKRDPVTGEFQGIDDDDESTDWWIVGLAGGAVVSILFLVGVLFSPSEPNRQAAQIQPNIQQPAESPPAKLPQQ